MENLVADAISGGLGVWLNGLLVFEPGLSAVVPNLVERGGDGMEESGSQLADDSGI